MDRMLALPVNDLEEASAPPREIVRMPTVSATLTMLEAPAEEKYTRLESPPAGETVGYVTDLPQTPVQPVIEEPPQRLYEPDLEPVPEEVIPPSITATARLHHEASPGCAAGASPRPSLANRCLMPLLWFNQSFDKGTLLLGGPGHWLRGLRGRHLLGLSGLALLAGAGLWLVKDWLGWTW